MTEGGRKRSPRRLGNELWPSCERGTGGRGLLVQQNWEVAIFSTTLCERIGLRAQAAALRINEGADAVYASLWLSFRAGGPFLCHLSSSQHKQQNIHCESTGKDQGMERNRDAWPWLQNPTLFKKIPGATSAERVTSFHCDSRQCIYIKTFCGIQWIHTIMSIS